MEKLVRQHRGVQRLNGDTGIERENERPGVAITARTAITRWEGERMDYGLAIDARKRGF